MAHFTGEYTVRVSPRARRVLLKVEPGRGLVVVLPEGVDPAEAPALVASRRDWVEQAMGRIAARGESPGQAPPQWPDALRLRALGEAWPVTLVERPGAASVLENAGGLVVRAADEPAGLQRLRTWVKDRARTRLTPVVRALAEELELPFHRCTWRLQRTRWGSCSPRGTLSLNAALAFLPPRLADQVFVHELCHLRVPDHSPAFWRLVEAHRPGGRALERLLSRAGRWVPGWLRG